MKEKLKALSVLLVVLSLSLNITSCSGDDEEKENNSIAGTWKFKEVKAGEVKTNSTDNDEKTALYIEGSAKEDFGNFTYVFAADGTLVLEDSYYGPGSGTYTFEDGVLKLMWGDPDDYDIYKVLIENGIFYLYKDYTEDCNDLGLDDLIDLGISAPTEYQVEKAIARISFSRQ